MTKIQVSKKELHTYIYIYIYTLRLGYSRISILYKKEINKKKYQNWEKN